MAGNELVREKVLGYLSGLSSSARKMLLRQLETSAEGSTVEDVRTILEAARELEAAANRPPEPKTAVRPRPDRPKLDLKTEFFQPYRLHVIEEDLPRHQAGWISKSSLEGIWTYLSREVVPETLKTYLDPRHGLYTASDEEQAAVLRDLRVEAFARLDRIVAETKDDGLALQRVQMRVGGANVYDDMVELLRLRDRIVALDRLYAKLPAHASLGEPSEMLLREVVTPHVMANSSDADLIAAGLSGRLSSPVILARIASAAARSEDPREIRRLPTFVFVDVALSGLERMIVRCEGAIRSPGRVAFAIEQIKKFHDGVRALMTAIQVDEDSVWRQRMSQLRRDMSEIVEDEIDGVIPAVRRSFHLSANAVPSAEDALEAEKAVAVFAMARRCRDSLAVNEILNRTVQPLEQAVDLYGRELFERMRKARGEALDRFSAVSENLLRIAEHLQGEDYAQSLRRSRDKALKDAGSA